MFWTGFFVGFAVCLALITCDYLYADYRHERRARAAYLAILTEEQQKQFAGFEGMRRWWMERGKLDWRQYREFVEAEKARQPVEIGLKGKSK